MMKVLEEISEHAMVAAFLRAEINSPRWQGHILGPLAQDGRTREVVDNPNLRDDMENNYRAHLLAFRGYRNNLIFSGFPNPVKWYSVSMARNDLETVRVMNNALWPAFSGGTRFASDASQNFRMGRITHSVSGDIARTSDLFTEGNALPEIILVGETLDKGLVILDGHVRTMAVLISDTHRDVEAIVGVSSDMPQWNFY